MKKNYCIAALFFVVSGVFGQDYFDPTVKRFDYLESAIPHQKEATEAARKLGKLKSKPNILIFLIDDLGYGDLGAYGGGAMTGAPTPQIDKLAQNGKKLTDVYSQPTCTPSRAALLTGRIPARSGLTRPILTGEHPNVNPWASENSTAKILSQNGYLTALSGKWHLGEIEGSMPNDVGFDEWLGFSGVASEYSQLVDARIYPDIVNKPERLKAIEGMVEQYCQTGKKGEKSIRSWPLKSIEEMSEADQHFADYSMDFIRRASKQNKPFFLVHSFAKLHDDNYPAKAFIGKSPSGFPYKDALVEVDDIVGRMMTVLKELNIEENTLVIVTSDNGPCEDAWPDAGHTPFRAGKGTTWEGGVRVPLIAYWKGMIESGQVSNGLFDLCDLFNTALAVAGLSDKIPSSNYIDGVDQTSFLLSNNGTSNRNAVFIYSEYQLMAIRFQEYKVHFKVFDVTAPRKNLDQATINDIGMSAWVYNLYTDPKEMLSTGHRYFEWGLPIAMKLAGKHNATFIKYPMKDIGLKKAK